jgi:hypothetical protein
MKLSLDMVIDAKSQEFSFTALKLSLFCALKAKFLTTLVGFVMTGLV